ncbi:unnamed protein product [Chrysoparadoxa australica]
MRGVHAHALSLGLLWLAPLRAAAFALSPSAPPVPVPSLHHRQHTLWRPGQQCSRHAVTRPMLSTKLHGVSRPLAVLAAAKKDQLPPWLADHFIVKKLQPLIGLCQTHTGGPLSPLWTVISPSNLISFLVFQLTYKRVLRLSYKFRVKVAKAWGIPHKQYKDSFIGFLEGELSSLSRVLVGTLILQGCLRLLRILGLNILPRVIQLAGTLPYIVWTGYFTTQLGRLLQPRWFPELSQDRRKAFIYLRFFNIVIWAATVLSSLEAVSHLLNIPIASTLAFGGVGGLAFGLASKDVLSNFFGGLMLLLSEPFVPGDMVKFPGKSGEYEGRVERVGWYQTRLRGRDTRPTYVPNSLFVDSQVTNLERITHRKFETKVYLPYEDAHKLASILEELRTALKQLPKVDQMSPFRVYLWEFTDRGMEVSIMLYFATKSFDEFLFLQQMALLETAKTISLAGSRLAYPKFHVDMPPALTYEDRMSVEAARSGWEIAKAQGSGAGAKEAGVSMDPKASREAAVESKSFEKPLSP